MLLRLCSVLLVCSIAQQQCCSAQTIEDEAALQQPAISDTALLSQLQKRDTKDNAAFATGFAGHGLHHHGAGHLGHGHHGHGKFFMYAHQPEHKHYEFGFKRGNDKHVVERYEKGGPHHNFKSKFRWHDKHGGHGERYWDYNHGPHHDDGGDGDGHYSEPVPEFVQPQSDGDTFRPRRKSSDERSSSDEYPKKSGSKKPTGFEKKPFIAPKDPPMFETPTMASQNNDKVSTSESTLHEMLGFDPFAPPEILKDHSSVGGIRSDSSLPASFALPSTTMPPPISKPYFRRSKDDKKRNKDNFRRASKSPVTDDAYSSSSEQEVPKLAYDLDSGRVFDEATGKWFRLVAD